MKRITKIEIENSRAYYDRLTFSLEKGENLLIYGENGSGKTSLYKSLNDFIQSFYTQVEYVNNRYKPAGDVGEVMLSIGDLIDSTGEIDHVIDYRFAEGVDNTNIADTSFLKALALTKGFLTYKDLLKVYLYEEHNPNLFTFFINHLLKDHIATDQGLNNSLSLEWEEINLNIFNVHNRKELKHQRGLQKLNEFERILRSVLGNLFTVVNHFLTKYFVNFNLQIEYDLKPMSLNYGTLGKENWSLVQDLRLKISSGNTLIEEFTEGLNEARLSAVAICLYLAALKANPGKELHLMFLDDIFIGIDSSNRWAIMEILENEFKDFQIIMATYDRSWYFLAKNYLTNKQKGKWKFVNLYSLPKQVNNLSFTIPILSEGTSEYDKAKEYLHDHRNVDLPAAANYFRKALEELISEKHLPKELFLSDDYSLIPGYKLTKRVGALVDLFQKIGENVTHIMTIKSFLHPLIHPLSHYEEEAQVYRHELIAVEEAIKELYGQIENLGNKCRLLIGRNNRVEIRYDTENKSYMSKYHIQMDDNLWVYKDGNDVAHLTRCACRCVQMEGIENEVELKPFKPDYGVKDYEELRYTSLDDALQKIYDYEVGVKRHDVVAYTDYANVFRLISRNQFEPLMNKLSEILETM